jgi:hypothetical protein
MLVGNVGGLYHACCFWPKGITHASSLFRFDFHLKAFLWKPWKVWIRQQELQCFQTI